MHVLCHIYFEYPPYPIYCTIYKFSSRISWLLLVLVVLHHTLQPQSSPSSSAMYLVLIFLFVSQVTLITRPYYPLLVSSTYLLCLQQRHSLRSHQSMVRYTYQSSAGHVYISNWNTSQTTHMSNLFAFKTHFNDNKSSWNVSNVITMNMMFSNADAFNQPLRTWNTSNVDDTSHMFYSAYAFNQLQASGM
ncbi:BspA family leucine-rich repeat surface protein [archaeon]|nr:MAG: BspA family leucine-rich repeat surface protein [archaeon]